MLLRANEQPECILVIERVRFPCEVQAKADSPIASRNSLGKRDRNYLHLDTFGPIDLPKRPAGLSLSLVSQWVGLHLRWNLTICMKSKGWNGSCTTSEEPKFLGERSMAGQFTLLPFERESLSNNPRELSY